jgi:hypothetical protein
MPIIVGLLAIGVSHAIDKYQERQAAKNERIDAHDQDTGFGLSLSTPCPKYLLMFSQETRITSSGLEVNREEEAFRELQKYADFQKALSSKVLKELSRDDSLSAPYSFNIKNLSNSSMEDQWYVPSNGARYTTQVQLPCPIIISQKAPGSDGPGWVRTYSPALMDCGIPQEPFLRFLDAFNESFQVRILRSTF